MGACDPCIALTSRVAGSFLFFKRTTFNLQTKKNSIPLNFQWNCYFILLFFRFCLFFNNFFYICAFSFCAHTYTLLLPRTTAPLCRRQIESDIVKEPCCDLAHSFSDTEATQKLVKQNISEDKKHQKNTKTKKKDAHAGVRTQAPKSRLRPERSVLDHSTTCASLCRREGNCKFLRVVLCCAVFYWNDCDWLIAKKQKFCAIRDSNPGPSLGKRVY